MMLNWLFAQIGPLTILLGLLLVIRPLIQRYLGARWQYSMWLSVPMLLLWPLLPLQLSVGDVTAVYQVHADMQKLSAGLSEDNYWFVIATAVWFCGIGVIACFLGDQHQLVRQQMKDAESFVVPGINIPCKQSHGLYGPYVTGWRTPAVLLPNDFQQRFDAEQQQMILQHELTHWRRGDLHANAIALVVLTLFWFHPLCWQAYRAYRQDQELACDAVVLAKASLRQKIAYSYALLSNAQTSAAHWQLLTNHYGDKKMMKQRLSQLRHQHGFSKTALGLTFSALMATTLWLQQPAMAEGAKDNIAPVMRVEPRYPLSAVQQRIEGYVVAEFDVDPSGLVQNVQIVKSVPAQVFDAEVIRAVKQWTYSPSATGLQKLSVQLDFEMDPPAADLERVKVTPAK